MGRRRPDESPRGTAGLSEPVKACDRGDHVKRAFRQPIRGSRRKAASLVPEGVRPDGGRVGVVLSGASPQIRL